MIPLALKRWSWRLRRWSLWARRQIFTHLARLLALALRIRSSFRQTLCWLAAKGEISW